MTTLEQHAHLTEARQALAIGAAAKTADVWLVYRYQNEKGCNNSLSLRVIDGDLVGTYRRLREPIDVCGVPADGWWECTQGRPS